MTSVWASRPEIVVVSGHSGFLVRIQSLVDMLSFATRITSDWPAAPDLVESVQPRLAVLDLVPGQEEECWLTLEAIKAGATTQAIPLLLCPVANWLLVGHEVRLAQHHVHVWPDGFSLDDWVRCRGLVRFDIREWPTCRSCATYPRQ